MTPYAMNPTQRAMRAVIFRWHCAGCLLLLKGLEQTNKGETQ